MHFLKIFKIVYLINAGTLVHHYPLQSLVKLAEILEIWCKQLQDAIWSVRENAAVALGQAASCVCDAGASYGEDRLRGEGLRKGGVSRRTKELFRFVFVLIIFIF